MPNDEQEPNDELELFPNEIDRHAVDDTDDGAVPDVDEVERGEDMGTDEQATEQTESAEEAVENIVEESGEIHGGFITDGLTRNETVVLLGMTAMSYALAWGLLTIMVEIGLNSVSIYLWGAFALLVVSPLILLFGEEIVSRMADVVVR